jgi:maleylacetoacetate isomerase
MSVPRSDLPVLYGNWRSSSSHRVHIALLLKGIDFRYVPVDLAAREQEGAAFRAVHPGAQVPVLVVGDEVLTQSTAILEALDELFPDAGPRLMPEGALARARVREVVQLVNSGMQPFQLPGAARRRMVARFGLDAHALGADGACRAFTAEHLAATLTELDRLVARTAGPFAVGAAPTLADCVVVPQLNAAVQFGIDVNGYAALSKVYERCAALPAFRDSHPSAYPDAPARSAAGAAPAPAASTPAAPAGAADTVVTASMAYKEPDAATLRYLADIANDPIPAIDRVREEAFRLFGPVATKASGFEVCLFLRWLAAALQARRVIEVGVFTGSSSLALLAGMPADGRLTAFDVSPDYTAVARAAWAAAGWSDRVDLRLVDASVGLPALAAEPGMPGSIDLAYVDGLNTQYQQNHEDLLPLIRPGGVIVYDNVLWKGRVASPGAGDDAQTIHLRELNARLRVDARVSSTVLSLGDGLALVVKK